MNYDQILVWWQQQKRDTVEDLRVLLDNFRIVFAYNSDKIENEKVTLHDTREIFENGKVVGYTGDVRTLFEIRNQKDCFDWLLPCIVEKREFTLEFLCELHLQLMKGCYDETRFAKGERPGTFKIHDYVTGDGIGLPPEEVETEVSALFEEIKEADGRDVLTVAAYLHLRFEEIHPFADGNGRVGRTLLNYYLITHDFPPLVLFDEDKKTYYMALTVYDKTGKIDGFLVFLREQMEKTWNRKETSDTTLDELL